ncbi:hypothetical protein [Aquidulcibacter sp.]|uniref:hypothetical protein n=1 Tax=Aquidulcibacter sp. TaxID=2052990 RepID=UPI003BA59BCE
MQEYFCKGDLDVTAIVRSASRPRLNKYLQKTGGDIPKALQVYHWNSMLSPSLYFSLQHWEIALRNRLNEFLIFKYGPTWPFNANLRRNLAGQDRQRLDKVVMRLTDKLAPAVITTDQIVAGLSAGFWVSQFSSRYKAQYNWTSNLKFRVFLNDAKITSEMAHQHCSNLLNLRNRVAHHEPILHLPLGHIRASLRTILAGICAATNQYVDDACTFKSLWNEEIDHQVQ